jgi:hypothetical protein
VIGLDLDTRCLLLTAGFRHDMQRYTDLYDETVALAKRVMLLEEIRASKNEELYFLRSKVATQSSIIETMNDTVVR